MSKNKKLEALKVVEKIAKFNKTFRKEEIENEIKHLVEKKEKIENEPINMLAGSLTFSVHNYKEKSSFTELFWPVSNLLRALGFSFLWICSAMLYYGVSLGI